MNISLTLPASRNILDSILKMLLTRWFHPDRLPLNCNTLSIPVLRTIIYISVRSSVFHYSNPAQINFHFEKVLSDGLWVFLDTFYANLKYKTSEIHHHPKPWHTLKNDIMQLDLGNLLGQPEQLIICGLYILKLFLLFLTQIFTPQGCLDNPFPVPVISGFILILTFSQYHTYIKMKPVLKQ